jgi:predicted CXXCH cytochrome family protein
MQRQPGFPWWLELCWLFISLTFISQSEAATPTNEDCIACHGLRDLKSHKGHTKFIDPARFSESVHARKGVGCLSCHPEVVTVIKDARVPHRTAVEPKCRECHVREYDQYSKSLHAQVSKKLCYACHNPHYTTSFREMSGNERKRICLACHNAVQTHRWLPQQRLHFNYLECTACHALNASIGLLFYMVGKRGDSPEKLLRYEDLEPFIGPGKEGLADTLDSDGDKKLSEAELRTFLERLKRKTFSEAALEARVLVLQPSHDFTSKGEQTKDCTLCHSSDASFYSKTLLEIPEKDGGFRTLPVDRAVLARFGQSPFVDDVYLLGESKIQKKDLEEVAAALKRIGFKWIDLIGSLMVLFCLAGVFVHAMLMFLTRKLRRRPQSRKDAEPMPVMVSCWHWLHGLCVVLLVATAIHLRLPDIAPLFATFLNAVNFHNLAAAILMVDYVFWLFYHLWKREFRTRFLVSPSDFFRDTSAMLHYYGYLIFVGEGNPLTERDYYPFDPLERSFFLTMMLLFLPVQMITGVLLYDVNAMMPVIRVLGGLRVVDAAHLLFAYVLICCVIIHLYFHTLKKYSITARRHPAAVSS